MKAVFFLLVALFVPPQQTDPEHPQVGKSSPEFLQGADASVNTLENSGFAEKLRTPSLGSSSSEASGDMIRKIHNLSKIQGLGVGERGITYDVILQPGHYERKTGKLGTRGELVTEQELVAFISSVIADQLRRDKISVLVISADNYLLPTHAEPFDGLKAKVFLSVHADGSAPPCKTGPSLAYKSKTSVLAMHAVGLSLSAALGKDYSKFRHDNFTEDEHDYYMFHKIQADRLTGLLEVGELTCREDEIQLIDSSTLIGQNIAQALGFIVHINNP